MRLAALALALTFALLAPSSALARPGDLDRSFGTRGQVLDAHRYTTATLVRLLPGGRILTSRDDRFDRGSLLALDARGRADPAFPRRPAQDAAPAGHGVVTLTTSGFTGEGVSGTAVTRYLADGRPDPGFGDAGTAVVPAPGPLWNPERVLVDAAGRVLVLGTYYPDPNTYDPRTALVRLTPAGAPDRSFGRGGAVRLRLNGNVTAAVTGPRGAIRLGLSEPEYPAKGFAARLIGLTVRGALDRHFGRRGRVRIALRDTGLGVGALLAAGRGRWLVAASGDTSTHLMRIRAGGKRDTGFPHRHPTPPVVALARDRRGRLLAGQGVDSALPSAYVSRYTPRGAVDRSFGRDGDGQVQVRVRRRDWTGTAVRSLLVDRRNRILVAGEAYDGDVGIREDYGQPHALIVRLRG